MNEDRAVVHWHSSGGGDDGGTFGGAGKAIIAGNGIVCNGTVRVRVRRV